MTGLRRSLAKTPQPIRIVVVTAAAVAIAAIGANVLSK